MVDQERLDCCYLAGLIHDAGKAIQKASTDATKLKHQIVSQLLVEAKPEICLGSNETVEAVSNVIAHHHPDTSQITAPVSLGNGLTADMAIIKKASDHYKANKYSEEIGFLKQADSMAASADRASETGGGDYEGRSASAPLISAIGKMFNKQDKRVVLQHGHVYNTYVYQGSDEKQETIEANDPDFKQHIAESHQRFLSEISSVDSIDSLDRLLKKYWSTINANTWRPKGAELGNTTTSLYDHDKMTSAIMACLYINSCFQEDGIDLMRITYYGASNSVVQILEDKFSELGLRSPNIIYATENDAMIILPHAYTKTFTEYLQEVNKNSFTESGDTLNYDIAPNWAFKNCRDSIHERFSQHFVGAIAVLGMPCPVPDSKEYEYEHYKMKMFAGYAVNNYNKMLDMSMKENDSISKLSTYFRIFDKFTEDVNAYLDKQGCEILSQSLDRCLYVCKPEQVHKIEKDIAGIYDRYVCGLTGLTFACRTYNRYEDSKTCLNNMINAKLVKIQTLEDGEYTTVLLHGRRYRLKNLNIYDKVYNKASTIPKTLLHKILSLYEDGMKYRKDGNPDHLIVLSRFAYLCDKQKDNAEYVEFIQECRNVLYDSEKQQITSKADVYYEAVYDAARRN